MSSPAHILYLTIGENITSEKEGVAKKLLAKVMAIRKICSSCSLLNASPGLLHNDVSVTSADIYFTNLEIGVKSANTGYLNKIKSDVLFYEKLASYIENINTPFSRIIFRYPFASAGLLQFCKKFEGRIVFEHNSKEMEEQRLNTRNKQYAPFSVRPSGFFYWYQEKVYPLYAEKYIFNKITAHAFAGSCVTTEIAEYEAARSNSYKTFVSSNFYDVSSASLSGSVYREGDTLCLGMIVTTTAPWYGLKRLFRSFAPVQDQLKLVIAGIDKDDEQIVSMLARHGIKKNVELIGKLAKEELPVFYNAVHICFGSLGLYTINLHYASTLKVKESLAYGIPVAIGYQEEDFVAHKEFDPYYLQLKNDDSLIDFKEIRKFALRFYADPQHKPELRALALKYMDVNVKMKKLLENIMPA